MVNSLKDLLEEEIRDLYDAEKQLVKALPKMAKAADSEDLRGGFEEHLEATRGHVTRLEEVFRSLDVKPRGKACEAMKGLVAEGQKVIEDNESGDLRDIALIGAAKKVEHYEMAAYQSVIKLADAIGDESVSSLLNETLSEEEATDRRLDEMCDELVEGSSVSGDTQAFEEDEDKPAILATAKTRRAG